MLPVKEPQNRNSYTHAWPGHTQKLLRIHSNVLFLLTLIYFFRVSSKVVPVTKVARWKRTQMENNELSFTSYFPSFTCTWIRCGKSKQFIKLLLHGCCRQKCWSDNPPGAVIEIFVLRRSEISAQQSAIFGTQPWTRTHSHNAWKKVFPSIFNLREFKHPFWHLLRFITYTWHSSWLPKCVFFFHFYHHYTILYAYECVCLCVYVSESIWNEIPKPISQNT